ncbi:pyruvate, water dikinase regulatory protein [Candidatus Anaplasma sp. TIGMIC]|uniref:pyruvate, water dikinase regulatory protein n=1 Tax=Candidatus Anaplasma sp. TIGMIC TaxID=3020713 RepID=UPI00232DEAD8|nr:pyruvate, water dikinase regulatory protein [Candidatus Anaplasma sp. TIGMIC]MDB1135046.1 kinase/pyrophosphorylase [Candidatus Anaplasma sp. TIGMIC]
MSRKASLDLHLVSDSTCETVVSVARASVEHFKSLEVNEFVWSLVGSKRHVDRIISSIDCKRNNLIMYTVLDDNLREYLKKRAEAHNVRCIPILAHIIREISCYLSVDKDPNANPHRLSDEYFNRIEAINYTIAHDDGQSLWDVSKADIVIVGVSRTSKSPTSIYLAYRGYKVVNIPFVHSIALPIDPSVLADKLVVGLTIDIDRLIQIRKNRLISMKNQSNCDYVSYEQVEKEISEVKKICAENQWPLIDVTQKSIEEIAATIIQFFNRRNNKIGGDVFC